MCWIYSSSPCQLPNAVSSVFPLLWQSPLSSNLALFEDPVHHLLNSFSLESLIVHICGIFRRHLCQSWWRVWIACTWHPCWWHVAQPQSSDAARQPHEPLQILWNSFTFSLREVYVDILGLPDLQHKDQLRKPLPLPPTLSLSWLWIVIQKHLAKISKLMPP